MRRHYIFNDSLSETELTSKVFEEVKEHIAGLSDGDKFDLITASETFAKIHMVYNKKSSVIKSKKEKITKTVAVSPDFTEVSPKLKLNGSLKGNSNNTSIYEVRGKL